MYVGVGDTQLLCDLSDRVAELLETIVIVGQARKLPDERYTALAAPG